MDQYIIHSDADAVLISCGKERAEHKSEGADLPLNLSPTLTYSREIW